MISVSTAQYLDDPLGIPFISPAPFRPYLWSSLQLILRRQQRIHSTKQFLESRLQERFLELFRSAIDGVPNSSEMTSIRIPIPAPIVNMRNRGIYAMNERFPG
jgi:hypothetical protein